MEKVPIKWKIGKELLKELKRVKNKDYCRDTHKQCKDDDCCDGIWKMFISKVLDSGGVE
jgi:hypothetical protein